jgi:hypothetical protein
MYSQLAGGMPALGRVSWPPGSLTGDPDDPGSDLGYFLTKYPT